MFKIGDSGKSGKDNPMYKHGYFGTPTYEAWSTIKGWCFNPRNKYYNRYGGRGITVCERWLKFENFLDDLGEKPIGTVLTRLDDGKNYEPSNCKWDKFHPKKKRIDYVGKTFNRFIVIKRTEDRKCVVCQCICGKIKTVRIQNLKTGKVKSCGCYNKEGLSRRKGKDHLKYKHGHSPSMADITGRRTYTTWYGMKTRCTNPNIPQYMDYGGRGIKICDRWLGKNGFINFLNDMGERPEGKSIDRTDNDGNYEPSNCRWATRQEQGDNTRKSKHRLTL